MYFNWRLITVQCCIGSHNLSTIVGRMGFPGGSDGKEYACDVAKEKN